MTPKQCDDEWRKILSGEIESSYNQNITDWQPIYDWIKVRIALPQIILDYGCGLAHLADQLQRNGHSVIGADISNVALEMASQRNQHLNLVSGDGIRHLITMLDYDIIIFTEVLEHIKNDLGLIQSIPPGRTVFISLPIGMEHLESPGHVRAFETTQDAINRYSSYLHIQEYERIEPHFLTIKATKI